MLCAACGTENPAGKRFCRGCGAVLQAAAGAPAPAPAASLLRRGGDPGALVDDARATFALLRATPWLERADAVSASPLAAETAS